MATEKRMVKLVTADVPVAPAVVVAVVAFVVVSVAAVFAHSSTHL